MSSPTSTRSGGTIRKGPTLRGGRYRPAIGRSIRVTKKSDTESDDEETTGLTHYEATNSSDYNLGERDSLEQVTIHNEKLETDADGKPIYHHGEETFGDLLAHPIQEYSAHKKRKSEYEKNVKRWSRTNTEGSTVLRSIDRSPSEHVEYILVVHFKQLKGNQAFALDHTTAEDFCKTLKLTQNERIRFNGVHDTDGLTAFLYKIKRDFSIKIHHKTEYAKENHLEAGIELNPHHHTIKFNDNTYIEFKPKHHHEVILPLEARRRPFFQHPEPDLSADIGEEKAASWLELFYDLFFVATLTQFTHSHHIMNWESLGLYAQWFVITWWAWCASSLYTARFDTDDVVHHIYKLIEMCAVIGMAGSSEYFLNSSGYVYGYMTLKGVLVIEYLIVFIVAIKARSKSRIALAFYVGANLLSIALWGSSLIILEKNTHRILWFLGVLSEVLVNIIVRGDKTLSWAASHLAERLGLLTLIVLGENLMGLVSLVSISGTSLIIVVSNFMAVVIIFGFFFMYFEDFNKEIFLHNKYHQVWVYLHFPLHLCQVAFGIALIDTLKLYRQQMILDHKIPDEGSETSSGHESTTSTEGSHGTATESASGSEGTGTSSAETAHASGTSEGAASSEASHEPSARKLAKRAIESIHPNESEYRPAETSFKLLDEPFDVESKGYLALGQYIVSSATVAAIGLISSELNTIGTSSHLTRRSAPAESGGELADLSEEEKIFVYKTFLIFGGIILVINSLIKTLNTKLSDIYGKIIIASRVINAIVLWSMCALPFAKLDAIVLLCTMLGSLIFQAAVDLLD